MTDITDIWKFDLRRGNSPNPREGACLLDAVSWLEYGTLGDHPACVCPVIAAFGRGINDVMSDAGRQRLRAFIPRLVGTVDLEHEQARAEYLAWRAIRVFAPLALDATGLRKQAADLRDLSGTLDAAGAAARAAAGAAGAAAKAAGAAGAAGAAWAARAAGAAGAAWAATWAATWAARAAGAAASAATWAARAAAEDAMIAALDGALAVGRQAESIELARFEAAVFKFAQERIS